MFISVKAAPTSHAIFKPSPTTLGILKEERSLSHHFRTVSESAGIDDDCLRVHFDVFAGCILGDKFR
jgi:hypothetical protein